MEKEIWKPIEGFESYYMASSLGNIKALSKVVYFTHAVTGERHVRTTKEIVLKKGTTRGGYKHVSMSKDLKAKCYRVCCLVAIAFIPNPENKPQVNHKNGIKNDDRAENLEWMTAVENMAHASLNGLTRCLRGAESPQSKKVKCLKTGIVYDSITAYSKANNIDSSNVSRFLSGKWKTNKYVEFYKGD